MSLFQDGNVKPTNPPFLSEKKILHDTPHPLNFSRCGVEISRYASIPTNTLTPPGDDTSAASHTRDTAQLAVHLSCVGAAGV